MGIIHNPVLPGFHPDPSILYHDGWFYIANSTFEWFGGVQISRSKDLAVWEPVGQALTRKSQLDMRGNPESGGIWAPCLSWARGKFYLIFTDVKTWADEPFKDTHNYLVTATAIEGPWSESVYLNSSGFDPSLFHDEDGRTWFVNMEWDYRKPGVKKFSGILLQEFDEATLSLKGPIQKIFEGSSIGITEGPHLYKVEGHYYLVTAEGGTEYGHAVSVARSKKIGGPYELHPENPLCSSRSDASMYLQKAGHGSWCQGREGLWFLAFLVGRPLPNTRRCVLGRETALAQLIWKDGWPYLGDGGNKPPSSFSVPWETAEKVKENKLYHFTKEEHDFNLDFMSLRLPRTEERFSVSERPSYLRIHGRESLISQHEQSLIARRQTDFSFLAQTELEFRPSSFQEMAGLVYRYGERDWYYLRMSWDEVRNSYTLGLMVMDNQNFSMPLGTEEVLLPQPIVSLGAEVHGAKLQFSYALADQVWKNIGNVLDASILSDEYGGLGFTGAYIGMACQDLKAQKAFADFKYFKYESLE